MKKIISALVVGAAAVGFATADLKISMNYRNGAEMFQYWNNREKGEKREKTKTLFDLNYFNAGKDSVTLKASGNIFSFETILQPTVSPDSNAYDAIAMNRIVIGADVGSFSFKTGFNNDGNVDSAYRAHSIFDRENGEGQVGELYKPGSALGGFSTYAINKTTFKNTGANYFALAGYKFGFGESLSLNTYVSAISNYGWGTTDLDKAGKYLGWSVFLEPVLKDVFAVEVLAKGQRQDKDNYAFVFGGYARLLSLPLSSIGGSVELYDGKVDQWNADLRLAFQLGDRVTFTTMNNFTKLLRIKGAKYSKTGVKYSKGNGADTGDMAKLGKMSSSQLLWDMVSLRFMLNDTLTIIGTVGQQTDFDSGKKDDGTQLYVYPHVQVFANSNISVVGGVVTAFGGIGAHKDRNPKFDVLVRVPVLVRCKL